MSRLLTAYECYLANLCERGTSMVGAVWSVSGPVTPNLLCSALDYVGSIHPTLRSEILPVGRTDMLKAWSERPDGKWYSFNPVSTTNAPTPMRILEQSFLESFKPKSTNTRVWLLENQQVKDKSDLVFVFNHALLGGRSLVLFMEHLLSTMSFISQGKKPSLEAQMEIKSASGLGGEPNDTDRRTNCASVPISRKASSRDRKWAVLNTTVSRGDNWIAVFKRKCKEHSVSINSLIVACFVMAMDKICKVTGAHLPFYQISTAVDVGGNVSKLQLCAYHVELMSEIEHKDHFTLWDTARVYEKELRDGVGKKKWILPRPEFSRLVCHEQVDRHLFDLQGRTHSFGISNLGDVNRLFELPNLWNHSPFSVENFCFTANQNVLGGCFDIHVVYFNGKLSITVGYPSPTYDAALIQELLDSAIDTMVKEAE